MATKYNRAIAGFFVILFIVSSSALTVSVILQMVQDSKDQKTQESIKASDINAQSKDVKMEDKLQGKPLANYTPGAAITELKTEDTVVGTGEEVKGNATVTVDYTGALASSGIVFESSKDSGQQATFGLDQVIKGWTQGIPGMKVGGTRRLHIPADLAYGAQGNSGIPANSDLVFDVTLHAIK